MKPCFGAMLLAIVAIVVAIGWWPAEWAKWVVVGVSAVFVLIGLFMKQICTMFCPEPEEKKE